MQFLESGKIEKGSRRMTHLNDEAKNQTQIAENIARIDHKAINIAKNRTQIAKCS